MFRDVTSAFACRHDGIAHFVFGELFEYVGPVFQHGPHDCFCFEQCSGVDFVGSDDGKAFDEEDLLVVILEVEFFSDFVGDGSLGFCDESEKRK